MLIESEKMWLKQHKLRLVFPPLNFLCIYWISYSVVFRNFKSISCLSLIFISLLDFGIPLI